MRRAGTLVGGWLFALALMAGFSALGTWQLGRGAQKQAMLAETAGVLDARRARPLAEASDPAARDRHDWAEGRARFVDVAPVLLDNQQRDGRVGVRVFRLAQAEARDLLLVDMGWLPLPGDRRLPALAPGGRDALAGDFELRGLLAPPPAAGLRLGTGIASSAHVEAGGEPVWLATRIEPAAISQALGTGPVAPRVLRLDPALPIGHERDLVLLANTLPPEKHRGYAVQWFGLAIATLLTALILTFRRSRP